VARRLLFGQRLGVEELLARVLVGDDEPDSVELLQEFLTGKEYEVLTASSCSESVWRRAKRE
jgi:DNA-binding response OmpR family regulator